MNRLSLINGQWLLAKILFIPTNGNHIAASGSWRFFAGRASALENKFARRHLEGREGSEAVVGGGGGLHFQKKKVWGGFGLVWFGLVSVKNALDYHAHQEFSTPLIDIE